jgi:hypothetical protein
MSEICLAFPMADWVPNMQEEVAHLMQAHDSASFSRVLRSALSKLVKDVEEGEAAPSAESLAAVEGVLSKGIAKRHFRDGDVQNDIGKFSQMLLRFDKKKCTADWCECVNLAGELSTYSVAADIAAERWAKTCTSKHRVDDRRS